MNKTFYILPILLLCSIYTAKAQEIPVYDHYYSTPYLINPAEAGTDPYMNVTLNHRQQWRGIDGAPVATTLTFQTPFNYKKFALGVNIRRFERGLLTTTDFMATYAYTVYLSSKTTLHFGLSGGITSNGIDWTRIKNPNDPAIANFLDNNIQPISNFGVKLQSDNGLNLDISLPRLFKTQYANPASFTALDLTPFDDITVMAYFKKPMDSRIVTRRKNGFKRRVRIEDTYAPLQIYALYKYSKVVGQRAEVLATLSLNENFWIGGAYRLNYGAAGLFGVKIKNFSFSYAYEPASQQVSGFTQGTHEIQLKINIGEKKKLERYRPKLRTIKDEDAGRAPRFSRESVQFGGDEEGKGQGKKYYVVVGEFKNFEAADALVAQIKEKKEENLRADIFFNKSNQIYYVYVYDTFFKKEAYEDKKAVEDLTKFKNVKVIVIDQ